MITLLYTFTILSVYYLFPTFPEKGDEYGQRTQGEGVSGSDNG